MTGDAGLFLYATIPKSLRSTYLKGFCKNPKVFLGFTKLHLFIHTLKILEKYHVMVAIIPIMSLSLILSLLPLWLLWVIFIGSGCYMAFIISRRFKSKFKKEKYSNQAWIKNH